MSVWVSVIGRSRVNDGYSYVADKLPEFRWQWPKGTWFQARLDYAREHEPVWSLKTPQRTRSSHELPAL